MAAPLAPELAAYLANHHVMTLATQGSNGPWAAAVFYAWFDGALIFLSSPKSRHAANLAQDGRCAATNGPADSMESALPRCRRRLPVRYRAQPLPRASRRPAARRATRRCASPMAKGAIPSGWRSRGWRSRPSRSHRRRGKGAAPGGRARRTGRLSWWPTCWRRLAAVVHARGSSTGWSASSSSSPDRRTGNAAVRRDEATDPARRPRVCCRATRRSSSTTAPGAPAYWRTSTPRRSCALHSPTGSSRNWWSTRKRSDEGRGHSGRSA
jgi:hypothetical protein